MKLEELVKLIEDQADDLADLMLTKIRESPRMAGYHRFGDEELRGRARLVYGNLEKWLEAEAEGTGPKDHPHPAEPAFWPGG